MTTQPQSKYDSGRQALPLLDRLRNRSVVNERGCWLWQGITNKDGYGRTKIGSRRDGSRRTALCHVAAWEYVNGPKPPGMTLDHIECDTPACCNPEHLTLSTMWENTRRSETSPTAVNARKTKCPKCGGPYTLRADGGRHCRPCRLEYFREYNRKRNSQISKQ